MAGQDQIGGAAVSDQQTTSILLSSSTDNPIVRQMRESLSSIIVRATNNAQKNTVVQKIQMRTALHLIVGHWVTLIQSGVRSKTRFQSGAFDAVARQESEETDEELRDRLTLLRGQKKFTADLEDLTASMGWQEGVGSNATTSVNDDEVREIKEKLQIVRDMRYLSAEAVSKVLQKSPWGTHQFEGTAVTDNDISNSTLAAIQAGMKMIVASINAEYGVANYDADFMGTPILMESDATRRARHERHGRWTDDELLELLSIHHFNPSATHQSKAEALNECMALRAAQAGLPKPLDRSAVVIARQLNAEEKLGQYL